MDIAISVFSLAVDGVLPVECVVPVKWLVRSKAVGVDSRRLILAVTEQESNRRFLGGFRRMNVRLIGAAVSGDKQGRLVLVIRSMAARGQATRTRQTVALAALLPGIDIQFVDLDRLFGLWPRPSTEERLRISGPSAVAVTS
jgi:hypothetical protein